MRKQVHRLCVEISPDSRWNVDMPSDAQNPTFDFRCLPVAFFQFKIQVRRKRTILVHAAQPFGDGISVMLMRVPIFLWECPAPESWINFHDGRLAWLNLPPVERPEMNATGGPRPDIPQPWESAVGRFRDRPLHVKVKDRLCAAGSYLRHSPPSGLSNSRASIAADSLANKVHVDILIGGPVLLKVVQEFRPV